MPKNWCFWTVVLEKTLESPLDCKEIKLVHPKGNQSWIFTGRTDAEAETPILQPPDVKNRLIGKDPDAGKDWRREEKGMSGDEMVGWHHWFNGHEFEQAPGIGDGQGGLACYSPWARKDSDTTEQLNWTGKKKKKKGFGAINCISLYEFPEKAMAPHSSTFAWKIPQTEEPGGLQSMGSWRVGHDWATSLSPFTFMHWRRKWQPTPVFLPGESQGQGSLVGCHLWGHTESDTTEVT